MNEIVDSETGELIPMGGDTSALEQLTRGEIDIQIATAHKFPRSIASFKKMATAMVTQDEEVARESIYVLPARRGSSKPIEGPSVRFAEMIQSAWGNCRSGARVIHEGRDFIVAQGVFHDLETNSAVTFEVQRRIVDSRGNRYGIDMIGVTANAACSVALRNAILKGIPKALWQSLYIAAKKTIVGDEKTFKAKIAAAFKAFDDIGVKKDALFQKLGVEGAADLTVDHLIALSGMLTAFQDGELSIRELIAETQAPPPTTAPGPQATGKAKKATGKAKSSTDKAKSAPEPETGSDDMATGHEQKEAAEAKKKAEAKPPPAAENTDKAISEDLDGDDIPDEVPAKKFVDAESGLEFASQADLDKYQAKNAKPAPVEGDDPGDIPEGLDRRKKKETADEANEPAAEAAPQPDEPETAPEEGGEAEAPAPEGATAPAPGPDEPGDDGEPDGDGVGSDADATEEAPLTDEENNALDFNAIRDAYANEMEACESYEELDDVMDRCRGEVFPNIPETAQGVFIEMYKENRTRIRRDGA